MVIDKKQAQHIADLIQVDISGKEEKFASILSDTLDYIEVLDELDSSGVEETFQVTGLTNVFQRKLPSKPLSKSEALSNASDEVNNLFGAPAVFER